MTAYVLVHGGNVSTETWNRLTVGSQVHTPDGRLGGRVWDLVVPDLVAAGTRTFSPTLGDEHHADLTDHIDQICSIISDADLRDVVLVGHSYGGMVITGVAARHPGPVTGLVYVDAALPVPGQSLFDIISEGGVDPLSIAGLEAAPPYVEQLDFAWSAGRSISKTYLLCTASDFAFVTKVAETKIGTGLVGENWRILRLPSGHLPMAEMPQRLSQVLLTTGVYD